MAVEHVEISAKQKAAADAKFKELMAAEKPEEVKVENPAEGEEKQGQQEKVETVTDAGEKQVNDEPVVDEKTPPEKEQKTEEKPGPVEEAEVEAPLDEESAIKAQEELLADKPSKKDAKKDLTPPEEKAAWKRVRQLEKKIAELAVQPAVPATAQPQKTEVPAAPAAPASQVIPTPAEVEAEIVALETAWYDGKYPQMDYAALEAKKTAIRVKAEVMAEIAANRAKEQKESAEKKVRDAQAETTLRIDKAIKKNEAFLPGLKEAFRALASDPEIKDDPIIGQAILQNLDSGGLHVAYYLKHHREYAVSLTELPVDERAAKLFELRMKLTRPKKVAAKATDFKPDKPIVNSHLPEKGEKEKARSGDAEVESEIEKARKKYRR